MKYISVAKSILNHNLIYSHIDSPISNSEYKDEIIFSGWAFSQLDNIEIKIKIDQKNSTEERSCNQQREDVVRHFSENNSIIPPIMCGFKFKIKPNSKIIIYCGDKPAIELIFSINDNNLESEKNLLTKLNEYHLENKNRIDEYFQISLKKTPYQYVGDSIEELEKAYWVPISIRNNIKEFLLNTRSLDFGPIMLSSALENGHIKIASPLDKEIDAKCDCSFYSAPFNYLRFISEGVVFYLLQHFSFCDAIYIPKLGILHFISSGIDKHSWKEKIVESTLSFDKKGGSFNSVFIAHNRPYHYNYELALGLYLLDKKKLLEKTPLVALNEEKAFFRPSKLINKNINEKVLNNSDFLIHLNQPGISLLAGHQVISTVNDSVIKNLISELDNKLNCNSLLSDKSLQVDKILQELNKCDVQLWFGITSQKRKLLNQVEEIITAINVFSNMFDRVGVVIDGWTSPLKKTLGDIKQIDGDNIVANNIINHIRKDNVSIHSIIGLCTEDKLVIAKNIDVFLANHASGSMHIDRMARRFGVTHNSNTWEAVDLAHIHNNSIEIAQDEITDYEPEGKDQASIDYTVKPKVIIRAMMQQYFNSKSFNSDID